MKMRKLTALGLSLAMAVTLMPVGALAESTTEGAEASTEAAVDVRAEAGEGATAVYATSTFGQKFSTFFATTAYDQDIASLTTGALLAADRGGDIIKNGIEGEVRSYNGTDYTYKGMGDVVVTQNDDGSVDYALKMRDDIVFSDGTPADIDDVIFGVYVYSDPTYDGSTTLYALPIEGMEEYRGGMDRRGNVIFAAGNGGYEANDAYTEDQYNEFWNFYNNESGAAFAQSIIDYCIENGYNTAEDSVAAAAANWGYELAEDATTYDFWDAMVAAYMPEETTEGVVEAATEGEAADPIAQAEASAEEVESAGFTRLDLTIAALGADYETGVSTGESAANISGITRVSDYEMNVHMTSFDAAAIYQMSLPIAPLHYYGDEAQYDYDNNQFGFPKGDLSLVKSKTTVPLGCGPYVFDSYKNGVVTLTANPYYFEGEPEIKNLLMAESVDADYVPGIITGTFDIAVPSLNDDTVKAIQDANTDTSDLVGDTLTTYLVDYRGYGYLGINADRVNVNGDPGSEESKNLRKGFMTLLSVYRDSVINSYYGDRASVIQYPISNTSWAAPQPVDEGYHAAYSLDVNGEQIYDESMNDEQKYEAALAAAIEYFKAAGFTYDEAAGKFTDFDAKYEVIIPSSGTQDHPAYNIVTNTSEALENIGITLIVSDVTGDVWNNKLEANEADMWAAAWQSTVDPDMTQVYSSENAHGNGTNSNHYALDDAELDTLIKDGKASSDNTLRKSIYKNAMEIIMDWGCELPLYQRKDATVVSSVRINNDTMPKDMTPYWGWYAEIQTLDVQ